MTGYYFEISLEFLERKSIFYSVVKKTIYLLKNLVNLFMLCLAVLITERNIGHIVCCVNM